MGTERELARYVRDEAVWRTPPIRPEGFQFEVQVSSLGSSYEPDRIRRSIREHRLGEVESAVSPVMAAEWGYSFTHLDGQVDGAGRRIRAGYPSPPADRAECLRVIERFLHRQYIAGAPHPWASMNGHFPWHHYAGEFGFDQIGSEIGENINNYQWHVALTRGAARQFRRPWFMDFSAWHGPSVTDYSEGRIWGEHSGPDHGHSMSLFQRALFLSYMSGAGQVTAEAGGAISFLTSLDAAGRYELSPYGEVCRRFNAFVLANPDIGVPLTPIGVVLDRFHGAYPGFGRRRAFWWFDYTAGDRMTWDLIDLIWPGGWEVMGKEEVGTMVNGPFGDTVDILLQNASARVLNSYPCLVLSGDVQLNEAEVGRFMGYVRDGGTLLLNRAYLGQFPAYGMAQAGVGQAYELREGAGRVVVYGPEFAVARLKPLLAEVLEQALPVEVSPGVEFLVNVGPDRVWVTLINNDGVRKTPRGKAVVDPTRAVAVTVRGRAGKRWAGVRNLLGGSELRLVQGREVRCVVPAGEVTVLELSLK